MKIVVHKCVIDQAYTSAPARWFAGDEVRIFIDKIVSYAPILIYRQKVQRFPKNASHITDMLGRNHFVFESPEEIDGLIQKATGRPIEHKTAKTRKPITTTRK